MADYQTLLNRLQKNIKKFRKHFMQEKIEAWRLYDRDIPQFPYIVDYYNEYLIVWERGKSKNDPEIEKKSQINKDILEKCIAELFDQQSINKIIYKDRYQRKSKDQYEKNDSLGNEMIVREGAQLFKVNLWDYLDTGLFLDHRPLRSWLQKNSKDKRVLNLFCYTGALSVAAGLGDAKTITSIDMSNTYLDWARRNMELNRIDDLKCFYLREDITKWLGLQKMEERFDIILLDPPSFSNSKKMDDVLDIQRDHSTLINQCMNLLSKDGLLIFSNNLRNFKMSDEIKEKFNVKDISSKSIPKDFRDQKIHQCFEIKLKGS